MAISLITLLGIAAGTAAGGTGIFQGSKGIKLIYDSSKKNKQLQEKLEIISSKIAEENESAVESMDKLGNLEMRILGSFEEFIALFEQIHNKPTFEQIILKEFDLPTYDFDSLEKVSTGAAALLAGATGGVTGVFGGFAAAGAVKSAVMAFGAASTGTSISTLSGAALTNATLAALGGGSLAAGGGGMALGTTVLGVSTLGVGLLIGGSIINKVGQQTEKKIDEMELTVKEVEETSKQLLSYLREIKLLAEIFEKQLHTVNTLYLDHLDSLREMVLMNNKTDWPEFTEEEKMLLENLVLLVGLLYNMCQVNLVIESNSEEEINETNSNEVFEEMVRANKVIESLQTA